MRKTIATALLAIALGTGAAEAQNFGKGFIELGVGVTQAEDYQFGAYAWDSDRSLSARLSGGFENVIGPLELRVDYLSTSLDVDLFESLDIQSVLLSGVVNFPVNDWLTVYAGAGGGIAMGDYVGAGPLSQFPGLHVEDTQLTWLAMGGLRARLFGGPASLFLEAQYQAAEDFEITPTASAEYSVLGAMTGLRWNF